MIKQHEVHLRVRLKGEIKYHDVTLYFNKNIINFEEEAKRQLLLKKVDFDAFYIKKVSKSIN